MTRCGQVDRPPSVAMLAIHRMQALDPLHAVLLQALNGGRRLVAHHASTLMPQLHTFVLLSMPSIEALRSTTSKTAMLLVQVPPSPNPCTQQFSPLTLNAPTLSAVHL